MSAYDAIAAGYTALVEGLFSSQRISAMPMIMLGGAFINVPLHQALSLHGKNLGRGGPGSVKRAITGSVKRTITGGYKPHGISSYIS